MMAGCSETNEIWEGLDRSETESSPDGGLRNPGKQAPIVLDSTAFHPGY